MKKNYSTLAFALLAASTITAQQLPNPGFEGNWELSRPWNTVCDTLSFIAATRGMESMYPDGIFGKTPEGWIISNVNGIVNEKDDGTGFGGLGATQVGDTVAGFRNGIAVRLYNSPNPFMASQIVPGYMSLGTSWATNTLDFATFQPINKDGGVFGGMACNVRPDALSLVYQRTYGPDNNSEQQAATVLVYSWKGTWSQADVPGNNAMMDAAIVKTTMVDRDRNILGMETAQGGEVTHTEDAELICKTLKYIEGEHADWTRMFLELDYLSTAIPEKINVVLAANDYFNSENINSGDQLIVDDVKFVYYSRLDALSIGGTEVEGFNPDAYDYNFPGATGDVDYTLLGQGGSANVEVEINGKVITVTVSNPNGADVDGLDTHVYTITCAEEGIVPVAYNGYLNIEMGGSLLAENQEATIIISDNGDNTCTFTLPHFALDLGNGPAELGDIVVPNVAIANSEDGTQTYNGGVEGLQLLGGAIIADVEVSGTIKNEIVDMKIDVMWNNMPINVTFTTLPSGIDFVTNDTSAATYYNLNGVMVNPEALPAGIYVRIQGNKASKVIIK